MCVFKRHISYVCVCIWVSILSPGISLSNTMSELGPQLPPSQRDLSCCQWPQVAVFKAVGGPSLSSSLRS